MAMRVACLVLLMALCCCLGACGDDREYDGQCGDFWKLQPASLDRYCEGNEGCGKPTSMPDCDLPQTACTQCFDELCIGSEPRHECGPTPKDIVASDGG